MDLQEQKRTEEWEQRLSKIQNAMSRMADVVVKKNEEQQRKEDQRFIQYANEKDRIEIEKEQKQKQQFLDKENEIKKALDNQIEQKRKMKADEIIEDKHYVQMVTETDKRHKMEEIQKLRDQQQKLKEVQQYQLSQIGDHNESQGLSPGQRKHRLGGPMNLEEMRMNKQLLKNIQQSKKNE